MRMSVICRGWTVAVLGAIAACAVVCATTACGPATTVAGPANPSVAGSTPVAEPPSPTISSASVAKPSSPGPAGDCRAGDLAYQSHAPGAAAGNYYDAILVVNHGASACRLAGYPDLYYTDASGNIKLVPTVPETPNSPPYLVASGGSAQFVIHTANGYGGFDPSSPQCAHPMLFRDLSVEVSGGRVPIDVQIDFKCGVILLIGWAAPQPH